MRGGRRPRVICDRCHKQVSARSEDGSPVAHRCPHGDQCVSPAWRRAQQDQCITCRAKRARESAAPPIEGKETCEVRSLATGKPCCSRPATHVHGDEPDDILVCDRHVCGSCRPRWPGVDLAEETKP